MAIQKRAFKEKPFCDPVKQKIHFACLTSLNECYEELLGRYT